MGQNTSKETKEMFGDKTVQGFEENLKTTKQKVKQRRKEAVGETVIFKRKYLFTNLDVFQKPMCLISTNEVGDFSVEEDTLRQIQQIDLPLVVIAIAGLYRTGKSYLMNLLAGHSTGFELGNTVQSKTKGIWVWCRQHPKMMDTVLVLLDTEGLGDVEKGSTAHDNKIFTLAALLGNVLVYNIMHAFNQDAVEKLTFITEISKNISFKDKRGPEETSDQGLALILPTFVLCIRDFSLQLKKDDGSDRSAKDYLDECLKSTPGDEKYNKLRECIKKYFPRRACFTFDRQGDRSTLQKLEELKLSDLSAGFRRDTELFLECMYQCPPKRLLCSKPVNGEMFAVITKSYVDAIRNGGVPDVDDAYEAVGNLENENMEREAVESFQKSIEEISLPVASMDELDTLCRELVNESLRQFRQKAVFNPRKFEDRALDKMDSLWQKVRERNQDLVTKFCQKVLDDVFNQVLAKKIQKKKYHKPGGYQKYLKDREEAEKLFYSKVSGKDEIIVKHVVFSWLERQKNIDNEIMACDKQLSEEEIASLSDWDSCIEKLSEGKITDAEKISADMYKGEIYPNQRQLNRLQQMRKTSHSIVSEVSKRICSDIQSKSKKISDVWPAYKFGQRDRVIFVVETNTTHMLEFDISYEYVVFSADYFGEDRKVATKESKINKELPQSETAPLVKFINKNAANLFTRHRHLSYIKPSLFRLEDSDRDKHALVYAKEQCLAFYVRRKDYTHLDEEPFESSYEGFPVVVREGAFLLQTEIKMGCEIRCSQDLNRQYLVQGKLGGFVEHPYYGLCGLTCAHVLLNEGEMKELIQRRGIQAPDPPAGICVCSVAGRQIGRLVKVVYEDGKNESSGMEFALFQIETGQPKSAEYFEGPHQDNFIKGRAYGDTRLDNGIRVYKLGANRTEGEITGVRTMTVKTHNNLGALLHSQMEVKSIQPGPFSVAGDSGSLVFVREDDEYICVGMVVGCTKEKVDENTWEYSTVVSPIVPVLEKLGVTSFKSFVTDGLAERLRSLETTIQAVESNLRSEIERILESFESLKNSMYGVESSHLTT